MRAAAPLLEPGAAPDLLVELYAGLSEHYARLAAELSRRVTVGPSIPSPSQTEPDALTTAEAAKLMNRTKDWFGRHRADYVSALISREGERPRYSRRLLERQLELVNRSRTRSS